MNNLIMSTGQYPEMKYFSTGKIIFLETNNFAYRY